MTRPRPLVFLLLALVPLASFGFGAFAADPADAGAWVLTTADFRSNAVALKSIDDAGVHVAADAGQAGGERVVGMDDFLQVERPMPASVAAAQQGKFVLHLAGGDQVAGEPASVQGEQLVWNNAAAGEIRVPMSRAVAITKAGQQAPERRPTEDVVTLANGDAVRGIIAGIEGGKISVQRSDSPDPLAVPVDSVASVQFAATGGAGNAGGAGTGAAKRAFRLRLGDGSSLPAATLTLAGGKLSADLGDGKPRPFDLSRVAAIEQVNGPASWLTDRQPAENVYVPYFGTGQDFPARMNAGGEAGRELRFGGKTFRRGIAVHAYSRLAYALDGQFAALRLQYAVDERMARADMTVRVKLDERVVHEKAAVRGGTLSPIIFADLAGAKRLTLEVDYGGGTDVQDRLVWLEPALLRHKPAEEPPAAPAPQAGPAPALPPQPAQPAPPASTPTSPAPTPATTPSAVPAPADPPAKPPAALAR